MTTMTHTISTDEVRDILVDIASDLDLDADSLLDALEGEFAKTFWDSVPEALRLGTATRVIATALASELDSADETALDEAMAHMATDAGWQIEAHSVVLWTEINSDESESLVVWLGNDRDPDMSAVGRAVI